jgi:predicted HTH transcriptional regulator
MLNETNRIEYKSELNDKFEREVVGFLNYHEGGIIYIGISEDGTIKGVSDTDKIQLKIVDRIKDKISPATLGLFDVIAEVHGDKQVIKIVVSSGPEKPYYIKSHGMSETGCFLRVGSSTQPMPQNMIDTLFARRARITLSNMTSPNQRLHFKSLRFYYSEQDLVLNEEFEYNLDLLTSDDKYNYLAYLLADNNGFSIKVAKYDGTDKINLIENEEYGYGCIITAANRVLEKMKIENKTFTKITSTRRLEKKMFDETAVREAIINAIVHNDYSREVPPVVEIFSDRSTITSYGGLPIGFSQEDFFNGRSLPRNRELMRVFKDVELFEQLGSGMRRILSAYDKSIFDFTPNFLIITIPFDKRYSEDKVKNDFTINFPLTERENNILHELKDNQRITSIELSQKLKVTDRTIKSDLKKLEVKDMIKRVGSRKTGYWEVL